MGERWLPLARCTHTAPVPAVAVAGVLSVEDLPSLLLQVLGQLVHIPKDGYLEGGQTHKKKKKKWW